MPIRRPCVAGQFYPGDKDTCIEMIKICLDNSCAGQYENSLIAGIVPHAGWVYSGSTAGMVFNSIDPEDTPDTFIFLGAVHRGGVRKNSVYSSGAWNTPMGDILIDENLAHALLASDLFEDNCSAHDREHSIEVNLPFISYLFPNAKILPIACPPMHDSYSMGIKLSEIVSSYKGKVIVIASTDLTHYGPSYGFAPMGIGNKAQEWVKNENDAKFIELSINLDGEAIVPYANKTGSACGAGAVAATVAFAKATGAKCGKLLNYTNSLAAGFARNSQDFVGYASIIFNS